MRREQKTVSVILAAVLAALGCSRNPSAVESPPAVVPTQAAAKKSIIGMWTIESLTVDGKDSPGRDKMGPVKITETTIDMGDGKEATYKLDPEGPGTIDLQHEDNRTMTKGFADPEESIHLGGGVVVSKARYVLNGDILGDTLTFCMSLEGTKRPSGVAGGPNEGTMKLKRASGESMTATETPPARTHLRPVNQWSGPVEEVAWNKVLDSDLGKRRRGASLLVSSQEEFKQMCKDMSIDEPAPAIDFTKQCAIVLRKLGQATSMDYIEVDKDKRVAHIHWKGNEDQKEKSGYTIAVFPKDSIRSLGVKDTKK